MKTRNLHMRLLSLVLCVCMVLSLMPAVAPVIEAEAANNVTPNYITDIGIAYAMNQSKAKSLVTNNGFTLMDKDLNEDAGGRYVYMGYKTSTDPSRAITGIIFREGENPPNSLSYGGATFYLVGGSYEGNGTGDGAVDLNVGAGGAYIYTYITRDTNYDYPILWMGFYSDFPSNGIYVGGVNTSGSAENLNADAGGISIYLNYITFEHIGYIEAYSSAESMAYMRHYYLDANGITVSKISTKQLKNHLDTYTYTPSVPANITLNGYSLAFKGWSTSNGNNPSTQTTSVSYWDNTDSSNYKCFYAVYATDFKVTYDANGGTGAPAAESYTVNGKPTGSGESGSTTFVYTRISSVVPTNTNGCKYFLGWSTNKNATSAEYQPNQLYDNQGGYIQFKTNTTLYAVWQDHYDINKDGECDSCQMTMTAPPTVNGAYQISNKNQLIWFMQHVNAGNKSASAVLTADIDMGGYVWTPIASTASYHESGAAVTDSGYTGTFDGAGHVIKNFTVTGGAGDGSSGASGNVKSYGLFGTVSGTVKNLGIDSYTFNVGTADCRAGAIVGQLVTGGRIENCYVINSKVLTGSRIAGAIAGCNYGGTIDSCFAYNCEVTGHARCAAIVGDTKDDGGSKIGTVTNCYADKNPVGSQNGGSSYVMNCATLTASQFTSGEAAWKLNGNSSDGIWKQTVGSGLPGFTGGTVYQVKRCDNKTVTYSNSSVNPQAHTYSNANGLCTFCGAGNPDAVASVSRNGTVTGVYTTLNDAIQAVKDFTDDDNAVVTILKDIALGNSYQTIGSGVFTIDLNGCEISSDVGHRGVLYAGIYSANLTVIDSRGGGKITGARCGIEVLNGATVTIAGGTISGGNFSGDCGVSADGSTVEISGGSINGYYGVCATDNSIVTISGGTISARYNGVDISDGAVIISSGTITGDVAGIYADGSTVEISNGTIAGFYYGVFVNNNCTLIVSDGTITSNSYCVMANQGTLTITGGTISGYDADINSFDSTVTLTLGEDGVGATFPGGIKVARTTLNAILGEGMAYWQGNKMIVPADDAKEITGGDVVIKAACKHTGDKTYTNNGDDHSFNCADCCNTIPEAHSYTNYVCVCGAVSPDAVASVSKNGVITGTYGNLDDAIQAVKNCTSADQAVVTILKNIDLGNGYQEINGGTFTFDLNGFEVSSSNSIWGVLELSVGADITITDSGEGGKITGAGNGIEAYDSTVTISGGTISSQNYGVYGSYSSVTISGGTISSQSYGVDIYNGTVTISGGTISGYHYGVDTENGTLTISGGTISSEYYAVTASDSTLTITGGTIISQYYGVDSYCSTVTISGGTISGEWYDIYADATLTVGEDGVGATFPGGITVLDTTLNAILGEGAAYWLGNKMIIPAEGAIEITGGDVVIKAACKHLGDKTYTNNGDDHSFNCADCCNTIPEAHSYTNYVCVCGAVSPDAVASVTIGGEVSYYATLDDAIQAVTNCTAADQAVVTILKDIALGNGYQEINGGMFTFDLNGFEVSSSNSSWGVLVLRFGADVTVTDSGESGKITGACYGIEAYYSTVTISGGTITGGQSDGVRADNSTVEISGGTISGEYGGVRADNSTVEISGGTISGQYFGVHAYNSTVTISGGTISGENCGVYGYESTVIISGGTISGENCGVSVYNSTVTIIGGTITGVQSDGVFGDESTVTISGGAIIDGYCGVSVNNDCTLIVSGGTITGVQSDGVYGCESTVTIIGGTISGEGYDIYSDDCTITLSVGENGVGATFLDGMEVGGTTLNAILGEGAAYWQNGKQLSVANDATSITGDVVIKAVCKHPGDKTYTNNGDDHTFTCADCNNTIAEAHSYSNLICACGAVSPDAVASVTIGGEVSYYATPNEAIQAVKNCTAADQAVVTILKDIDLGKGYQRIEGGVFTIDLNGCEISSSANLWSALYICNGVDITITDSGEGGKITGDGFGIEAHDSTVTISGGIISGQWGGAYADQGTLTISGGTISGEHYDICGTEYSTIILTTGEDGVGATFPGGISLYKTTLNAILGEGAAYWQGGKMIVPADGATSITGGDVVIKAPCTHSGNLIDSEYYSNEFHQKTCGCGFINELEEHRFGADSVCEDCGYDKNTITITMTDDWGDSWNGNGIHVYKDGVLIGTVTLESGYTGTWSCPYDPDAEYAFYWQRGNYPEECSFEISIAGETVKKVSGKVCSRYIDGQLLYPLPLYSGWIEMDGKWYYYDPETNEPVTGVVRVPYPTEPINGITYGPNPEDVAYCESKGQTFVNKDTAWFWFNYDGSFKSNENGVWHLDVGNTSGSVLVVDGMVPWHVGMVAALGGYYYFIGDETNGANKYAVGDVYITRNTADRDFVIGGVYTFDEYGALCEYDGITEVNGVLRYYEDARLMAGNGLTKVGDNYIYVRSNGELAVDCKYYVPGNDLGIASGLYTFDENGFMVEPVSTDKNGVYFENGAWYYYENGKIGYNKGLINVSTNWHFEDGSVMGYTAFIYVRSSGKLATGDYYITNVSNGYGLFSAGQKVNFSEDGMAAAPKNGIHEIDGSLYYFVNNRIQYNAGLMEYNGGWIYVRSNGVLATGKYWITNTNGNLDAGMYEFGADGYMVITDAKDGIVNDNGVLHYYLDGKKRYGLGLIQLPEGTYIYVRTNGELAVGSYWITNHNGLLSAGMYEFSEDGILINN